MNNIPCHGCWWIEGGRCYQDKLLDVAGVDHMPRKVSGDDVNGLEITDPLITACVERGVHQLKSAVYGRLFAHLNSVGIKTETISTGVIALLAAPTSKDTTDA